MPELEGRETGLADLSDLTVEQVQGLGKRRLADLVATVLRQVDRPRVNLGGTGPPGRAD